MSLETSPFNVYVQAASTRYEIRTHPSHSRLLRRGPHRDEAHALFTQTALSSASRPTTGWSTTDDSNHQATRAAFRYEREHPNTRVELCEVDWIGRHTSVPLAVGGVWWDYLFFDDHDKLPGYRRRFLD